MWVHVCPRVVETGRGDWHWDRTAGGVALVRPRLKLFGERPGPLHLCWPRSGVWSADRPAAVLEHRRGVLLADSNRPAAVLGLCRRCESPHRKDGRGESSSNDSGGDSRLVHRSTSWVVGAGRSGTNDLQSVSGMHWRPDSQNGPHRFAVHLSAETVFCCAQDQVRDKVRGSVLAATEAPPARRSTARQRPIFTYGANVRQALMRVSRQAQFMIYAHLLHDP